MIGFLIRATFWFSLVLLLMPFGGSGSSDELSPLQALLAARDAVQDISGMCERKPEVCEAGKSALHTIGVKAKASAEVAYQMLDDESADQADAPAPEAMAQAPDATIKTGTVVTPEPRPAN